MKTKRIFVVGVSCVGSGVGQSVVNSCRLSRFPIKTIGLGTNPMAYGLYECDDYAYTVSYYDDNYIENILKVCLEKGVDILVPGHDDEAHLLSKHVARFEAAGVKVIVSGPELLNLCCDKNQMSRILNPVANIFVRSFTKDDFICAWDGQDVELPVIAKPRDGFASRGIEIIQGEQDFDKITDGHIVQELALPHDGDPNQDHCLKLISMGMNPQIAEVSIQYVFDQSGSVIGKMASYNKLNNGVPIEILPFEDEAMWADVELLLPTLVKLGARGPVNLQGRITNKGIKLFEINARFTGITGLRAALGFNEVEACIRHWMGLGFTPLLINQNRVGIRQTADKAVDLSRNPEIQKMVLDLNARVLKKAKTILITGASGAIGSRLVTALSEDTRYQVVTLDRDKTRTDPLAEACGCLNYDYKDLEEGRFSLGNVDCLIHLASARPHSGSEELAQSLSATFSLLTRATSQGVSEIINISSQSVYGTSMAPPWSESSSVQPEGAYACYKYAIEVHLETLKVLYPLLRSSSVRLAAVAAPDSKSLEVEVLGRMTVQARRSEAVKVFGGSQKLERIDIRDAISGIIWLLNTSSAEWKPVYNLGPGAQYSLREIAQIIVAEVHLMHPELKVEIEEIASAKEYPSFGMDISNFRNDFGWRPHHTIKDSIQSILKL